MLFNCETGQLRGCARESKTLTVAPTRDATRKAIEILMFSGEGEEGGDRLRRNGEERRTEATR